MGILPAVAHHKECIDMAKATGSKVGIGQGTVHVLLTSIGVS